LDGRVPTPALPADVPQVAAAQLPADVSHRAVLLDVRENHEWAAGHAPGAVHVPLGTLGQRVAEVASIARERQVVVVCAVGARSQRAAVFLAASGLDTVNVADGMQGWASAGRPIVTGP